MPVVAEPSSSSTTIGEHIRFRRPRNQTSRHIRPISSADDPPLTHVVPPSAQPTRLCKSAMSSFFLVPASSSSNETSLPTRKKPSGFPPAASFRGLGCTAAASQQVSVPAVIRSSAEWGEAKKVRDKKKKNKKTNNGSYSGGSIKIFSETRGGVDGGGCVAIPDVWCGPGIGFSTDAVVGGSVDPVVSGPPRRNAPARRKIDGDRNNSSSNNNYSHRETSSVLPRRSLNQEFPAFLDSDSTFVTSRAEPTMFPNRHHRHFRHPYPEGLAEIMMLQNGFAMGGVLDSHDHFRDLRLDVDNMSYEQLLELGERIGYVNTGLKEEEIHRCLRKIRPLITDTPTSNSASHADKKCSICQEEYEGDDETGKLNCGHSFHVECVKQWLSRKNACPVCKIVAHIRT